MKHIMIDIETFALTPNAALASIGAVVWDGTGWGDEFYMVVDDPDGDFSPSTIRWHGDQRNMAATVGMGTEAVHYIGALNLFSEWLRKHGAMVEGTRIWSHATFDIPVLTSAYKRAELPVGWHHRNCRDLRTLYDLAGGRPSLPAIGTSHNALDDARYQKEEVYVCYHQLGKPFKDAWGAGAMPV